MRGQRVADGDDGELDGAAGQAAHAVEDGGHQAEGGGDGRGQQIGHAGGSSGSRLRSPVPAPRAATRRRDRGHRRSAGRAGLPDVPWRHDVDRGRPPPAPTTEGPTGPPRAGRQAARLLRRRRPRRADRREGPGALRRRRSTCASRSCTTRTSCARSRQQGAVFVDETDEVPEDATVVFSAHGVAPTVHAEAKARAAAHDRRDLPAGDQGAHRGQALRRRRPRHHPHRPRGPRGGRRARPARRPSTCTSSTASRRPRPCRCATPRGSPTCRRPRCRSTRPT